MSDEFGHISKARCGSNTTVCSTKYSEFSYQSFILYKIHYLYSDFKFSPINFKKYLDSSINRLCAQ